MPFWVKDMKNKFLQTTITIILLSFSFPLPLENAFLTLETNTYKNTKDCTAPYSGPDYYVSAQVGNDAFNGSAGCPFQTIQKAANSVSANAGHQVFVHNGIYRETLNINTPGVEYHAYPMETPIIDGSQNVGTWTQPIGEVYYISTLPDDGTGNPITVQIVIADDILLDPVDNLVALAENTFYQDGSSLYAQFKQGMNPNTSAVGVVKLIEDYNEADSVTVTADDILFSGFEIRFAAGDGIFTLDANNITINNCTVKFANLRGVLIWRGENNTVNNCTIHSNVLSNYPRLAGRLTTWGQGISFFSGLNGTVTNNLVSKNHGEGIGAYGGWNNEGINGLLIEKNTVYDSWSVNIYIDGSSYININRNLIYGSGDYPLVDPDHEDIYHQNIPIGIQMAKETVNNNPGDLTYITLSNNLIIDCYAGIRFWLDDAESGLKNLQAFNNTLINHNNVINQSWTGISIDLSNHHGNSTFANNLILQTRGTLIESGGSLDDITFEYNGWHHTDGGVESDVFYVEGTSYSFGEWCGQAHKGEGSLFAAPSFVDGTGLMPGNYRLQHLSVMRNQGKNTDISEDYIGTPRPQGGAYDIGAFEFCCRIYTPILLR